MDPQATLSLAMLSDDPEVRKQARRDYIEWVQKGGLKAEVRVWSNRVFGVPVRMTVSKIGGGANPVLYGRLYHNGAEWMAGIPFTRVLDEGSTR